MSSQHHTPLQSAANCGATPTLAHTSSATLPHKRKAQSAASSAPRKKNVVAAAAACDDQPTAMEFCSTAMVHVGAALKEDRSVPGATADEVADKIMQELELSFKKVSGDFKVNAAAYAALLCQR